MRVAPTTCYPCEASGSHQKPSTGKWLPAGKKMARNVTKRFHANRIVGKKFVIRKFLLTFAVEMKIGPIDFGERPVFLAPMEDVTDIGFRMLCKRFGAAMVYTEFVSAEALIRDVSATVKKLEVRDEERPVGIQLYGRDVEAMVEAARIVEQAGPDLIDLNFGCPVKKVAGKGAGAGMLQNIPKMLDITRKVVDAVSLPVTVKTRLGWNHEQLIISELAPQLQDCGI